MKFMGILLLLCLLSFKNTSAQIASNHYDLNLKADTALIFRNYHKSPLIAVTLSLGNTVVPVALGILMYKNLPPHYSKNQQNLILGLLSYGLIIGPSIGIFYDHYYLRGFGGLGFRVLCTMAGTYSILLAEGRAGIYAFDPNGKHGSVLVPAGISVICASFLAGSIVYQFIEAPVLAAWYNQKHKVTFAPTYFNREKSLGLAMDVQF